MHQKTENFIHRKLLLDDVSLAKAMIVGEQILLQYVWTISQRIIEISEIV